MKCVQDMDIYGCLPEPPRPTNAVRRYDIGYNHDTKYIPLFDMKKGVEGNVSECVQITTFFMHS